MDKDILHLMDYLGIEQAHVVGISMGGMIAQNLSAQYPERIHSLTSIFSTTGAWSVGQPTIRTQLRMLFDTTKDKSSYAAYMTAFMEHIGGKEMASPPASSTQYWEECWDRAEGKKGLRGRSRQLSAIFNSGNRSSVIKRTDVPALVIHGNRDLLIKTSGGRATAALIAGSKFVMINGFGHHISEAAAPYVTETMLPFLQESRT